MSRAISSLHTPPLPRCDTVGLTGIQGHWDLVFRASGTLFFLLHREWTQKNSSVTGITPPGTLLFGRVFGGFSLMQMVCRDDFFLPSLFLLNCLSFLSLVNLKFHDLVNFQLDRQFFTFGDLVFAILPSGYHATCNLLPHQLLHNKLTSNLE